MTTGDVACFKEITELRTRLNKMPEQMTAFSRGLRSLYAENAVSGDQSMDCFRNVRDSVRRDAAVYVSKVLPFASTVVLNLSSYFDTYLALDFESWQEFMDDIVSDLEGYENACQLLIQMHESLMTSLKRRQDEATVAIEAMGRLTADLEQKVDDLQRRARDKQREADTWTMWGTVLAPVTLGVSAVLTAIPAHELEAEARSALRKMVGEKENAQVVANAAQLTKTVLIPVVSQFLDGLSVCQAFFAQTRFRLMKMSNSAETAGEKREEVNGRLRMYFAVMKKNAVEINTSCDQFVGSLAEVCPIQ
jgi:predicted lactoylglutathione lyase/regulator of replication initiation timing